MTISQKNELMLGNLQNDIMLRQTFWWDLFSSLHLCNKQIEQRSKSVFLLNYWLNSKIKADS
jgi:hypothetical protein